MKKERKLALLGSFPELPPKTAERINKPTRKFTQNFVVFLTRGDELFARCYHQYYSGRVEERQRYVFAKDGCCRYGTDGNGRWTIRTEFREPVFCVSYGYQFDNSYTVLNREAIRNSCMKYCCSDRYDGDLLMCYLALCTKHPNVEYLMKSGYSDLISEEPVSYYWSVNSKLVVNSNVDLKPNNLLKMLRLNRTEFKLLRGSEQLYTTYMSWRMNHPGYKPAELLDLAKAFGCEVGTAKAAADMTGLRVTRIASYLAGQDIPLRDYLDYVRQCRDLQYDLNDTAIALPRNFAAMHARLSNIIEYAHDGETSDLFALNYEPRRELEYAGDKYLIRQPQSIGEITAEGKLLNHCVGGYAKRHAEGVLTILFVRRVDDPDVPLYTMELSNTGKIAQIRGKNNCDPTKEAMAFIEKYKQHIAEIFRKKARKIAC